MSDVFPKWTNRLPCNLAIAALLVGVGLVAGVTYYFTPKYTRVGYQPIQPVAFSHKTHVNSLTLDCRYCHTAVESSAIASLPTTSTCLNCHNQILKDDPRLDLVRESAATGKPIPWVRVSALPDFVYFNHAVHVKRGVDCVDCHGAINNMDETSQVQPMSMTFCLECHRNPAPSLHRGVPVSGTETQPTTATGQISQDNSATEASVADAATLQFKLKSDWKIQPLDTCTTCHR